MGTEMLCWAVILDLCFYLHVTRIHYYSLIALLTGYDICSLIHDSVAHDPATIGYPAYIGDPPSIRTLELDPRIVFETRLILEDLR